MTLSAAKAWHDLVWSEAEQLRDPRYYSEGRHKDDVVPEYRPDAYDISGIRCYASSARQPRETPWVWEIRDMGDFTGTLLFAAF